MTRARRVMSEIVSAGRNGVQCQGEHAGADKCRVLSPDARSRSIGKCSSCHRDTASATGPASAGRSINSSENPDAFRIGLNHQTSPWPARGPAMVRREMRAHSFPKRSGQRVWGLRLLPSRMKLLFRAEASGDPRRCHFFTGRLTRRRRYFVTLKTTPSLFAPPAVAVP